MAVKVQFEIGHTSKLRSKKTHEGFTHDWELYVQGVNKADISAFVEKVVFNLHDSFPKPKRALKEPPYVIKESGYAGFLLPIDIYFRNRDEPKRVQFTYDLDLQQTGPPKHRCEVQKFIFECPSEEFRQKLIKGGGIAVSGVVSGAGSTPTSVVNSEEGMVSKPKLSSDSGKKHKVRSDESKMNTFANLFGTPITKNSSKFSPDGKSSKSGLSAGGPAVVGPSVSISNSNTGTMSGTSTSVSKDKSSKDKEKSSSGFLNTNNAEKVRDKSEKKHKLSSPNKDSRSGDSKKTASISEVGLSKHDKRNEDKPKKDKSRDKDRDRSREKSNVSSGTKRSLSPKTGSRDVGPSSPKRSTPPRPSSSASVRAEDTSKINKPDGSQEPSKSSKTKDQSSSSSGKKSKKDKKEKDRDKDKHSNAEHKHRADTKPKDVNNTIASEKESKGEVSKKTDKDIKADISKLCSEKPTEKLNEKESNSTSNVSSSSGLALTTEKKSTSSTVEKDKKSHKHKKKDKSKDKDKEKDKDKIKEKDKDQIKDRDKDPMPQVGETTLKAESNNTSTTVSSTSTSTSSLSKKSQNKEKKSKDKLNKEEKKNRDEETNKNKQPKTSISSNNASVTTTTTSSTNNLDLSDVDSIQSGLELSISRSTAITTIHGQHSDSSNSSFPELPPKSSSQLPSTALPANRLPEATQPKDLKNTKEHKQNRNEKNPVAGPSAVVNKPNEKDDKKRRRNSTAVTTFIEPPLKQIRKELNKAVREKSKSPSLRSGRGNSSENTFLPPPSTSSATNSSGSSISSLSVANTNVSSPAIASSSTNESNSNNIEPNSTSTSIISNNNNNNPITTALPTEYLIELQELHHKIMTLQDNEDLQQVVEMIAATGCYEITAKTFDFDLCKLDRNTVQRLQEFFATSVS